MKKQPKTYGPNSVRGMAAAAGLSLSQMAQAKAAGVDCKSAAELAEFRKTINTRSDDRTNPVRPMAEDAGDMTVEQIESALRQRGLSPNEARVLKTQVDGLRSLTIQKQAANLLISRDAVKDHFIALAESAKAFLKRYRNDIPQACNGLTLPQAKQATVEKTRELEELWATAESEFWKQYPTE